MLCKRHRRAVIVRVVIVKGFMCLRSMVVMPLRVGRHRSLSPQPHHRNTYPHSPHPPNSPASTKRPEDSTNGTMVCEKELKTALAGVNRHPSRNSDPGSPRMRSRENSTHEVAAVQSRQLALRLGKPDDSPRLLRMRHRGSVEVKGIRRDIPKVGACECRSKTTEDAERLSDVLSHSPISLNLPRISSRNNSPAGSPARARKARGDGITQMGGRNSRVKVVVKDFSRVLKSEPQRTSSDSDISMNDKLLSPAQKKRSMSATCLYPLPSSIDFPPSEDVSRSATASPQNTPIIQIEQYFDELRLRPKDHSHALFAPIEDQESSFADGGSLGENVCEKCHTHSLQLHGTSYPPDSFSKQYHHRQRFSQSENNIDTLADSTGRYERTQSTGDVSASRQGDGTSASTHETSSPSSTFLQLPSSKVGEGLYEENLSRLSRHSDVAEPRSLSQERGTTSTRSGSRIPSLPELSPTCSPLMSPRTNHRRAHPRTTDGKTNAAGASAPIKDR